jgi:serine/threonine-protein kinase
MAVLFTVTSTEAMSYDDARIEVLSLDTGERHVLVEGARRAWYVKSGHLVYARAGGLFAVPFDLQQRRVTGAPAPVASGVSMSGSFVHVAISDTGVLAFVPADELQDSTRRLVWIDRHGEVRPVREERRSYLWPRISPDGRQVATVVQGPNNTLWVHHVERATFTRVTFKRDVASHAWTPDSRRLLYSSPADQGEELYVAAADGGGNGQRVFTSANISAASVSPDGTAVAVTVRSPKTGDDIWMIALGSEPKAEPFLQTPATEYGARISPDGRWLAYVSNEAGLGRYEVYVRAFPGPGERHQISTNSGRSVAWAASGRELFYRERDRIIAVDVRTGSSFSAGVPRPVFALQGRYHEDFDVTPDGQRFVMVQESENPPPTQINVALNWGEALKRLVPR